MKYDLIIGNPPFMKDLHLKILDKVYSHVNEGGELVWLAPVVRLVDIRNIYDEHVNKKFNEYKHIFHNVKNLKVIPRYTMEKLFNISPQNTIGIISVDKKSEDINENNSPDMFINLSKEYKTKIKTIIETIKTNSVLNNDDINGDYSLKIPQFAGHTGKHDRFWVFNINYQKALNSKSNSKLYLYFKSDEDRYDYWKFWTSDFGYFIISLWKNNTSVYPKYIPYLWWKTEDEAKEFFNLTDDEIEEISSITMAKIK